MNSSVREDFTTRKEVPGLRINFKIRSFSYIAHMQDGGWGVGVKMSERKDKRGGAIPTNRTVASAR